MYLKVTTKLLLTFQTIALLRNPLEWMMIYWNVEKAKSTKFNSLVKITVILGVLALLVVGRWVASALLVHDTHELHPWVVLWPMAAHAATLPHSHVPENGAACFLPPGKGWYAGQTVKIYQIRALYSANRLRGQRTFSNGTKPHDGRSIFISLYFTKEWCNNFEIKNIIISLALYGTKHFVTFFCVYIYWYK